jgi:hypothetical protein
VEDRFGGFVAMLVSPNATNTPPYPITLLAVPQPIRRPVKAVRSAPAERVALRGRIKRRLPSCLQTGIVIGGYFVSDTCRSFATSSPVKSFNFDAIRATAGISRSKISITRFDGRSMTRRLSVGWSWRMMYPALNRAARPALGHQNA